MRFPRSPIALSLGWTWSGQVREPRRTTAWCTGLRPPARNGRNQPRRSCRGRSPPRSPSKRPGTPWPDRARSFGISRIRLASADLTLRSQNTPRAREDGRSRLLCLVPAGRRAVPERESPLCSRNESRGDGIERSSSPRSLDRRRGGRTLPGILMVDRRRHVSAEVPFQDQLFANFQPGGKAPSLCHRQCVPGQQSALRVCIPGQGPFRIGRPSIEFFRVSAWFMRDGVQRILVERVWGQLDKGGFNAGQGIGGMPENDKCLPRAPTGLCQVQDLSAGDAAGPGKCLRVDAGLST